MDTKWKIIGVTVVFGLVGFMLQANSPVGKQIWGEAPPSDVTPDGTQIALLIVVGVTEALAFGLGFAFLLFGWSRVANTPGVSKGLATGAAAAITWGLVSWVPHSAMHITNGSNYARLIFIEYAFHVTLIVAAIVLARYAYRMSQAGGRGAGVTSEAVPPVATP